MAIHDWTRVGAGIFHDFHHTWITEIKRALNAGLLPPGYYALAEQIAGGLGPDVLALEGPAGDAPTSDLPRQGGVALASRPPKVQFHATTEMDQYAAKAKAVTIRHSSNHEVIAMVEIVSPGNKNNRHGLRAFVGKAEEALRAGIHLLIVDLFPPGPRDPQGIHEAIWGEFSEDGFALPAGKPLTLAAYIGGPCPEAFVEPVAVGDSLPDMPLFLTPGTYVPVPLAATYESAWQAVPSIWRDAITTSPGSGT
ncbi:MAG TPA: DUF4058 family protein [Tepidisphaeraceae bacterium]|jgi:hypothetical protein|nr:DUF4058 family protein [Tepidisphaeraceae bacterium]